MVMIAICSSLIGAVLGTRLRVLVLLPVSAFGLALVVAVAAINGLSAASAITAASVLAVCLQLGYVGGLLTRLCLTMARTPTERPLHSTFTVIDGERLHR